MKRTSGIARASRRQRAARVGWTNAPDMYEEFVHIVLLVRWSHAALRAQRIGLATHVDIRGWTEMDAAIATAAWLAAFHAGERSVMERCYRDQCVMVLRAAGAVLPRA